MDYYVQINWRIPNLFNNLFPLCMVLNSLDFSSNHHRMSHLLQDNH